MQGLQKSLINKTIGNSSQITITSKLPDNLIGNYENVIDKVKKSDSRIKNVSPVLYNPTLIKLQNKTYSVLIRGVKIDDFDKIYNLKSNIYEGKFLANKFETVVGKDLKTELGLNLNDNIGITANSGQVWKAQSDSRT